MRKKAREKTQIKNFLKNYKLLPEGVKKFSEIVKNLIKKSDLDIYFF